MFNIKEKELIFKMLENLINSDSYELHDPKIIDSIYNKVK